MVDVILVNEKDEEIGSMEKLEAHKKGKLHRAFSVHIYDSDGKILLQQRATKKYHSGGLWSNSVCSHPRPGKNIEKEIHKRVKEELGCNIAQVTYIDTFTYKVELENLVEHEVDHVYKAKLATTPFPNRNEVEEIKRVNPKTLQKQIDQNPEKYTYWFKEIVKKGLY